MGTAQPLDNFLHCLICLMVKKYSVYSVWAFLAWIYACCLFHSHHAPLWRALLCLLHTLPMGASRLLVPPHPQVLRAGQVPPQFPPRWNTFYNRRRKKAIENKAVDDFQSHKTLEIIPLLLQSWKMSEVEFRMPLLFLTPERAKLP